jgi:peptidoglycan/xylan/chitin deacetylase (PgdA/CDA1 family)
MVTRLQLAELAMSLGIRGFSMPGRALLLVLNYHRLRPAMPGWRSQFDDGVFDTDIATFQEQMEWLRKETEVLDEEGLIRLASGAVAPERRLHTAITFDDGYVDCIRLVQPVLDALGIRGIFFIPVQMIDSRRLGWWDLVANLLKRTTKERLVIDGQSYDLARGFATSLQSLLNRFKLEHQERTNTLLEKVAAACEVPIATPEEQDAELMSWGDVRALHAAGHAIGAHSLTHRVLATLDAATQAHEIRESGRQLETILGSRVRSFAYPVGGPQHINADSVRLARGAGYELAFTFNTGIGAVPPPDRFQVPRESARTLKILKAKALFPGLMRMHRPPPLPVEAPGLKIS